MEISEMSNEELFRRYAEISIETNNKYTIKKQMEQEIEKRLREGRLVNGNNV